MFANASISMATPPQPATGVDAANSSRVGISSWTTTPIVSLGTAASSASVLGRTLTSMSSSSTIKASSERLDVQERASQSNQRTILEIREIVKKKVAAIRKLTDDLMERAYWMGTPWIGDADTPRCPSHVPGYSGEQELFRMLDVPLELAAPPSSWSARGASMPMMTVFWSPRRENDSGKEPSLSGACPIDPAVTDQWVDAPSLCLVIGSINTRHHCGGMEGDGCRHRSCSIRSAVQEEGK